MLTARAVMDLTELVWALSADAQNTLVTAPTVTPGTRSCAQGGRTVTTRPTATLLRIEHEGCRIDGLTSAGRVEAEDAVNRGDSFGSTWMGTVRWAGFSLSGGGRTQAVSATAIGGGFIDNPFAAQIRGQPLALILSGLTATRTPDALGRGATLASPFLRVDRFPIDVPLARDLYAIEGCATFSAAGLAAELCIDPGSRIALLENIGTEQLTGRLRWNAGSPGGFDARLRVTPAGAVGSTALRVELDLDHNGDFEAAATLDRTTDIGLRL